MYRYKFSANTGFLWRELPFVERIKKAGEYGFGAVEFHDEVQRHDLEEVKAALRDYDLPVISLNTEMDGIFGCAAMPDKVERAREVIDNAIEAAKALNANAIHILSGRAEGAAARDAFVSNLSYAFERTEKTILLEPISQAAVPGYFLNDLSLTNSILREFSNPQLKIMFDCYHVRHQKRDLEACFLENLKNIEHVQISSFPTRNEPFDGEIEYSKLIPAMKNAGYAGYFGCEYIPENTMKSGINWRETFAS